MIINSYEKSIQYIKDFIKDKTHVCLSIDGMCGSGKTTFSQMLKEELNANLVHIDHFYIPKKERKDDWFEAIAGNMNLERFESTVLIPFKNKEEIYYQRFNQYIQAYEDGYIMKYNPILIVDGSYSQHNQLKDYYHMKIFMICSKEEQHLRLSQREGMNMENFISTWIPKEEKYFSEMKIKENADLVFDTTGLF